MHVEVRIGCAPDVPVQRLQAFLGLLYQRLPDLAVDVSHLPSAEQVARIHAGDLDVALVHDPRPDGRIEAMPIHRGDVLHAFVALSHRLAGHDVAGMEDLAGEVLLMVPRRAEPGVHARTSELLGPAGHPFRAVREAPGGDPRDRLFAAADGRGVALAPHSALRAVGDIGDAVAVRRLRPAKPMPPTLVAWSTDAPPALEPVFGACLEIARELCAAS